MGYICGVSRNQMHLLPGTIDDYIGEENPVRFLDVFVEKLDLEVLGFQRATPAETGRPAYDPGDLLRLYLYGYLNRVRTSRRLDAEALRDSLLYVAGNLDLTAGGKPTPLTDKENRRRTIYGTISRRKLDNLLGLFDFPNPNSTSAQRITTNTALQGLFFLNSELVLQQAEAFASRLERPMKRAFR